MSDPKDQTAQASEQPTDETANPANQELSEDELDAVSGGADNANKGSTVRDSVKGVDDALSQF